MINNKKNSYNSLADALNHLDLVYRLEMAKDSKNWTKPFNSRKEFESSL
jgi:hypothetical protein